MQPIHGIAFKVISVCLFMCMASLIKATADSVPPGQAVFFRSFFALPIIFGWLAIRHELRDGWKTQNPLGHFWFRLSTVALGMAGVMIVLSPRLSAALGVSETLGAIVVFMSAVFAAMAQVFVRKLVATEGTAAIVFWFTITSSLLSLLTIPWGWVWPGWPASGLLICAGLFGGVGQIFLTSGASGHWACKGRRRAKQWGLSGGSEPLLPAAFPAAPYEPKYTRIDRDNRDFADETFDLIKLAEWEAREDRKHEQQCQRPVSIRDAMNDNWRCNAGHEAKQQSRLRKPKAQCQGERQNDHDRKDDANSIFVHLISRS